MGNPIVKNIKPELYSKYTKHLSRADRLSYNYSVIDDYIKEHISTKSIRQMASDLNEYDMRITYRIQVLRANKIVMGKHEKKRLEAKATEYEHLAAKAKALLEFYEEQLQATKDKLSLEG